VQLTYSTVANKLSSFKLKTDHMLDDVQRFQTCDKGTYFQFFYKRTRNVTLANPEVYSACTCCCKSCNRVSTFNFS